MSERKAKLARKQVYGDRNPLDRKYRIASDKRGKVIGKFIEVDGKQRLWIPTIIADFPRQLYQRLKREK